MADNEVQIVVKSSMAFFHGKYPRDLVDDATSAKVEGAQFSPAFRARRWDGKMHLLSRVNNSFPAGVLDLVVDTLTQNGYTVLIDSFDRSSASERLSEGILERWDKGFDLVDQVGPYVLRDYQVAAGQAFLAGKGNLPYNGILHVATGGGKTVISAAIVKSLLAYDPSLIVMFLVHGKSLVTQARNVFVKCFGEENIGVIQGDNVDIKPITIASVDSINSKLKAEDQDIIDYLQSVQLVIPDECHRFSSKTYVSILKLANPPMRLGLSGTPIKRQLDRDLLLQSQTGPVLTKISSEKLQNEGHIAKADLTTVVVQEPVMNTLAWRDAYNALIVENHQRTALIAKLAINRADQGKTVLILAGNSVAFADYIDAAISSMKLASGDYNSIVNGTMPLEFVDGQFDKLRKKTLKILTTTMLADEGIDIPSIDVLMLVGGGKSYVKAIQRIGRGLRIKEDGGNLEVVDFFDTTNPYLSKHAQARIKYYVEEKLFMTAKTITEIEINAL